MAKPYYLCAYGHVIRISERCDSEDAATRFTFGISNSGYSQMQRVTLLRVDGKCGLHFGSEARGSGRVRYAGWSRGCSGELPRRGRKRVGSSELRAGLNSRFSILG